jgi:flagellar biosynthetic protein FliO
MEMFQQLFAVAFVLGGLVASVWLLKRKGWARISRGSRGSRGGGGPRLEVIDRLVLTPQHSLHLVRLQDRTLLVGLSPSGCNLLETAASTGSTPSAAGVAQ